MLKRLGLLFLLLFLSRVVLAGPYDPRHHWRTVKTGHFAIHYYEGEEEIVGRLVPIVEGAYDLLSKKFDARPWGRTEVVVADQHDAANGFTMAIPYNLILLRVASPLPDSNLADYDDWLRELFIHEYTHVIHITDTRYPAKALKFLFGSLVAPNGLSPGWVTEGIATYFETVGTGRGRGRSSFTDMLIRTDILNDRFLKLDQMAGNRYSWPSWMAQYLYGVAFWQYLADTYGEEKIAEFSHRYGRSLWFYSLNNKAKKTFGKSFYLLWRDWKKTLEARYAAVKERLGKEGLQEGAQWLQPKEGESFAQPVFSRDGRKLVYLATSLHHRPELRVRDLTTGEERVVLRKTEMSQMALSPDGGQLVYSKTHTHKRYYRYSDLYQLDLKSRKAKPLTQGKRVRDPDFSPDGKELVSVLEETGRSRLAIYDVGKKDFRFPIEGEPPLGTEFNHPRWSPDGRWIAVSVFEPGQPRRGVEGEAPSGFARGGGDASPFKGERNLWLVDAKTGAEQRITRDAAIDDRPVWSRDGRAVYYSSDAGGIPNITRYDRTTGRREKTTNLLTGGFAPAISPDGEVAFQYYNGTGYEIRRLSLSGRTGSAESFATALSSDAGKRLLSSGREIIRLGDDPADAARIPSLPVLPEGRKYTPFPKLLIPRYLTPNGALIDNAIFLSVLTSNFDPLERHSWFGDVTFRSDNRFVGFDVGYTYSHYGVPFSLGFSDYSVSYGDFNIINADGSLTLITDFFEERRRTYGGAGWTRKGHGLSGFYFFENRNVQSGLPAGITLLTLGRYSGIHTQYSFSNTSQTTAAVSTERGFRVLVNSEVTDEALGASGNLEQQVFWGDARTFIPLGGHHVLAFRSAGGIAFGDRLIQGNFGLGGSLGESPFSGASTRVFTLRGLPIVAFSRDRAWVASAEYRFPLFYLERGVGTLPFAVNAAHFALFADVGDAYTRNNPSFRPLMGVGAELKGEFVLGYYLPITGRLGYGVIVTNRDRVSGLKDSLTGQDVRNGIVILELGTSF